MFRSPTLRWGLLLGFALGGFFDGIVLHQILQWHHLLSLVPGVDLRGQILWDGYFHALMYVLAALGLWGLWRIYRAGLPLPGQALSAALLGGFGGWHIVDSVLSHWLLGIHRIRVDSPNPLAWDLAWLVGFGLAPVALAWWLRRRNGGDGAASLSRARLVAILIISIAAGGWALRGPTDASTTTVVFRDTDPAAVFAALDATEARLIWGDPEMGVLVLDVPETNRWRLYRHGALLVSGTGGPAGCLNWSRA
ncbi:DUF2243 domain-containing protein [Phenylobacterium sp.]|uniref:DUF2243 domain-containing protein n=1 Tax=Phenylobacterium sp. TaxID=1871053 RepID=UPI002631A180|nr:DUF2243 domain-containing protein [Phenylobacterium sp.]